MIGCTLITYGSSILEALKFSSVCEKFPDVNYTYFRREMLLHWPNHIIVVGTFLFFLTKQVCYMNGQTS